MAMSRKEKILAALWLLAFSASIVTAIWAGMWLVAGLLRDGAFSILHFIVLAVSLPIAVTLGSPLGGDE